MIWIFVLSLLGFMGVAGYFWVWPMLQGRGMGPREVAVEFLEAMEQGNAEKARLHSMSSCDELADFTSKVEPRYRPDFGYIGNAKVDGDKAIVPYKYVGGLTEYTLALRKEAGKWQVSCVK